MIKIPEIHIGNVRISSDFKPLGMRSGIRLRFVTLDDEGCEGEHLDWCLYFTPELSVKSLSLKISYHLQERNNDRHFCGVVSCSVKGGIVHEADGPDIIEWLQGQIQIN